jgi:undecaprenyl-diphosphatase
MKRQGSALRMDPIQIVILAAVQGLAELLPISSSAHVIVAEKLMGLDPTTPAMTLLLVMLHTGTMFAVIVYFWNAWRRSFFSSIHAFRLHAFQIVLATVVTGIIGLALLLLIKWLFAGNSSAFEIEHLFGNSGLIAGALAAAGLVIIVSSRVAEGERDISPTSALWIGAAQGLCLPFRGFSRSGVTISTGLALRVSRRRAEEFSFALAVVLTPVVIAREAYRLYKSEAASAQLDSTALMHLIAPSLLGMILSFVAGLVALRWLSRWLEHGRWYLFGIYCLVASLLVLRFA